ncbi:MAG: UDP-N-acetylmuramate dehydrogenase [Bacteroidota bacterium]
MNSFDFQKNVSLKTLNSFGIEVRAELFYAARSIDALLEVLKNTTPSLILGGGSNILFTKNVDGLVLQNCIPGREIIEDNGQQTIVKLGSGENWHECVLWSLSEGLSGLENLSLIPGCIGAAPIQNIGAYGVELKDLLVSLEAVHIRSGEIHTFIKKDCKFGYRDSIFKNRMKGQYCITSITLKLSRTPNLNISYGAIQQTLEAMNLSEVTPKAISDAVIAIRSSKLPDPSELGNAGSFFKNPIIPDTQFRELRKRFANIVSYPQQDGKVKVPAGWLIEQCGWKGKRVGNTGAHAMQALVLVNYGDATGQEIRDLAWEIAKSVYAKFGILLIPEVNVF